MTGVAVLVVVAAVVAGLIVALTGSSTSPPAGAAAPGVGSVAHAVVTNEAAADVAVVATGGTIIGGPVLSSEDGQLWMVELSQATRQPVVTTLNPVTYAMSTYRLPTSLGGLSLRYTGALAYGGSDQVWLDATAALPGQQPTAILVRFTPATGAATQIPVLGGCSSGSAAPPAQLFAASDGSVWVECTSSQDPTATSVFRLGADGTVTQPYVANYANRALQGSSLWNEVADLPRDKIGPLAATVSGTMWGLTTGGVVQFSSEGIETFIPAVPDDAVELETQAQVTVGPLQLVGNGLLASVGGLGECLPAGAQAGQARECAISLDPLGDTTMIAGAPADDGHLGGTVVHPAGMDRSGDVWFIVDGTAGGQAPAGQYYFEATIGGGTRVVPFSVPGGASPVSAGQQPVITFNGAVWTTDPAADPGALVEVMAKN